MFPDFWGNRNAVEALTGMIAGGRIPQTLLFAGPEGVGKATLARRFAAELLGRAELIERDDLSLEENLSVVAGRERWPADKRNDDPLVFGTHPDFLTFAPDGPLRQISIQQMRLLKERSPFMPLHGDRRVFLVDHLDRANEQAANSLLKTLEEPPPHLVLIVTAENAFDLLPTIRSRCVILNLTPLPAEQMHAFARTRDLDQLDKRIALAEGCPGVAATLDLEIWDKRRRAMLALLEVASGTLPYASWVPVSESLSRGKAEKLDLLLRAMYPLLSDLLALKTRGAVARNQDLAEPLGRIAGRVDFTWIAEAGRRTDELVGLVRRNIQKTVALDGLIAALGRVRAAAL
jgi:DNA polymerase III subunit delta'